LGKFYVNKDVTIGVTDVLFDGFESNIVTEESMQRYLDEHKSVSVWLMGKEFLGIPFIKWDTVRFIVKYKSLVEEENGRLMVIAETYVGGDRYKGRGIILSSVVEKMIDEDLGVELRSNVLKQVTKIIRQYKNERLLVHLVEGGMMVIDVGREFRMYIAGVIKGE